MADARLDSQGCFIPALADRVKPPRAYQNEKLQRFSDLTRAGTVHRDCAAEPLRAHGVGDTGKFFNR